VTIFGAVAVIRLLDLDERTNPAVLALRRELPAMLDAALNEARLPAPPALRIGRDGGAVLLVQDGGERLAAGFVRTLYDEVCAWSASRQPEYRMRLMVGLDHGHLDRDGDQVVGAPLRELDRVAGTPAIQAAIASAPDAPLFVLASERFFTEVLSQGVRGAAGQAYAAVPSAPAFLRILGAAPPARPALTADEVRRRLAALTEQADQ
jgi:hypothetical protein